MPMHPKPTVPTSGPFAPSLRCLTSLAPSPLASWPSNHTEVDRGGHLFPAIEVSLLLSHMLPGQDMLIQLIERPLATLKALIWQWTEPVSSSVHSMNSFGD